MQPFVFRLIGFPNNEFAGIKPWDKAFSLVRRLPAAVFGPPVFLLAGTAIAEREFGEADGVGSGFLPLG